MKRHQLALDGSGDFCARSSRATRASVTTEDPELQFEEDLMAALEPAPEVVVEAEPAEVAAV